MSVSDNRTANTYTHPDKVIGYAAGYLDLGTEMIRKIYYCLLMGEQGEAVRQIATQLTHYSIKLRSC
jgi:hypothetical protein